LPIMSNKTHHKMKLIKNEQYQIIEINKDLIV